MIRVLVVDDHEVIRNGLHMLIEAEGDLTCVGLACNGVEAVAAAAARRPDVVVMDLFMPRLEGVTATRRILRAQPQVKVLALTVASDEATVRSAYRAGVAGYICKDVPARKVIEAIRAVHLGEVPEACL